MTRLQSVAQFMTSVWRPFTMFLFAIGVFLRLIGVAVYPIAEPVELKILEIVQIGLGLYVAGRSVEKGLSTWVKRDKPVEPTYQASDNKPPQENIQHFRVVRYGEAVDVPHRYIEGVWHPLS